MKKTILILVLLLILIVQLEYYFNIKADIKEILLGLKQSPVFMKSLLLSLGATVVGLVILGFLLYKDNQQKALYSFSKKKSRSEFEIEKQRETRRQVEALVNSAEFKKHKEIFKTTEEFIQQRDMEESDEIDDLSSDSDGDLPMPIKTD